MWIQSLRWMDGWLHITPGLKMKDSIFNGLKLDFPHTVTLKANEPLEVEIGEGIVNFMSFSAIQVFATKEGSLKTTVMKLDKKEQDAIRPLPLKFTVSVEDKDTRVNIDCE